MTSLVHPREYLIIVAVALGIDNLCGFVPFATQNSNYMMKSYIQLTAPGGKNEFLKIFIKACKSTRILVHGLWKRPFQKGKALLCF